jgi:molybdopterin-guanine dinucleotide biosynthesis protein A
MGNVDKGLELLEGRPLIDWVLQRLAPQVDEVLINANRNLDTYATLGHRVIEDRIGGFAGPLAGLHSALSEARHALMISVPCDTPFLPEDLVARLLAPLVDERIDLSVAKTGTRAHPVICLMRKRLLPHLTSYIDNGGRKVDAWYSSLQVVEVGFDDEEAFRNINTPEELKGAKSHPGP